MSPYFHVVGVLFLPVWMGMGNPASASCDTNNGCGDEASLLQIGVGAEQEKLGQLTDGAGMEGRSAMLQYGDDMLRSITKKYGNASSNIEQSDKDMLTAIVGIINGTMYASIGTDHGEDQLEINTSRDVVVNCNVALDNKKSGDISTKRISTEAARQVHKACREGGGGSGLLQVVKGTSSEERSLQLPHDSQDEACQLADNKLAALNQVIFNIPTPAPPTPTFPSPRTLEAVTAFFTNENLYITWFNNHKDTFVQAKNESDAAKELCESHKEQCDDDQHAFELQYDLFRAEYNGTCDTYALCFGPERTAYGAAKTRVEASMVNRKLAFEAGETIIYKIECLLGYHGCVVPFIDSSAYDLDFPALPDEETCNASEVQHQHCSQEFIVAEYASSQGHVAVAKGLNCP